MPVQRRMFRVRRLGLWLPAAIFFALSLLFVVGARHRGEVWFPVVLSALTGYWLFRSLRVAVEVTESGLTIRGQVRTRHFDWREVSAARLVRMRTASPFQARWPYVALALELTNGRLRRFDDVSAAEPRRSSVERIAEQINAVCGG